MNETFALLVVGFAVTYTALLVWMLFDCWKHESSRSDKIAWTVAFIVVGFVTLPIYFFVEKCGRAKRKELANARAKAAVEARQRYEMQYGLRKRDDYQTPDKQEPRTTWTPLMTSRARWAHGQRKELLPGDLVFKFDKSWSGPIDFHGGDLGYAIERDGRIVAEYVDPTLAHLVLPKSDRTTPTEFEQTHAALKAITDEIRQAPPSHLE